MTLDQLQLGEYATIAAVGGAGALRRRLLDMGLTPNVRVLVRKRAPFGDPIEIFLRGYELTLRREDARNIRVLPERGGGYAKRTRRDDHGICTDRKSKFR